MRARGDPGAAGWAGALVLGAALWGLACADAPRTPPRHVLLVVVDTLRADHLGLYGYPRATSPRIDALGREGVVFEHAIVQWPVTSPSMASQFSGLYPHITGVVIFAGVNPLPRRMWLLPEALQAEGFRTAAVIANPALNPQNHFDQGFEVYRTLWREPASDARAVTDAALAELEALAGSDRRGFVWAHYIDPHDPYAPPPGYAEPFLGDAHFAPERVPVRNDDQPFRGIPHRDWVEADETDVLGEYVARYDGEIRYADEQIGRLLDGLAALGLADETLVVLTSDHGESLGEHEHYFNHGHVPYEEQLRVPLVLRWPDGRFAGRRVARPVELRGLARSLTAAVGVPDSDNRFEGANWLAALEADDESLLPEDVFSAAGSSETRRWRRYTLALRRGDWKLVWPRSEWARERHGGRERELYDLARDPVEARDLAPEDAERATALNERLEAWFRAEEPWKRRVERKSVVVEPDTREALRALGYLDAAAPDPAVEE